MDSKRLVGYDYIRILACFMVILNHTIGSTIWALGEGITANAFIGDFLFNAAKMHTTSFILLSGALLLKKQETYREWFVKRVLRILIVIFLFSALYYDWGNGTIGNYFVSVFSSSLTNAYWYLYLYLGIMLILPLLRKFCISSEKKDFILLIIIFLTVQGIYPILNHYFKFPAMQGHFAELFTWYVSWIIVFLLGYYFDSILPKIILGLKRRLIICLVVIWFVGNLIPTIITYYEMHYMNDNNLFVDNPFLIWSFVAILSLDLALIYFGEKLKHHKKFNTIIAILSSCTFGIYLFGDKIILLISPLFTNININIIIKILIMDISIFIIGAVITLILKKIPYLKKLL